jgi:hypothetical protein
MLSALTDSMLVASLVLTSIIVLADPSSCIIISKYKLMVWVSSSQVGHFMDVSKHPFPVCLYDACRFRVLNSASFSPLAEISVAFRSVDADY